YDKKAALITGASLSLSNPLNITYWAALGGTVTALGASHANASAFTVFLTGFMLSSIVWCFICAGLIAWLRSFIGPFFWKVVNYSCALCLIYFSYTILRSI
ncbi:LysE family transporter, partial [Halomonas sp. BC2]|uniref:LysE family transporter n=1 Tax=Halomonas sp. BC2 TaxID=1670449 RepID=UPI001483914F